MKQLIRFFILSVLTIFSQITTIAMEDSGSKIEEYRKNIQTFYNSQKIRITYLDTLISVLNSDQLDIDSKVELTEKYDSRPYKEYVGDNNPNEFKQMYVSGFLINCHAYSLKRHYMQNFAQ